MLQREHFVSAEKMFVYIWNFYWVKLLSWNVFIGQYRVGPDLDMWRSQGIHWRNTACTHSGISCVSASLVRLGHDDDNFMIIMDDDDNDDCTCGDSWGWGW